MFYWDSPSRAQVCLQTGDHRMVFIMVEKLKPPTCSVTGEFGDMHHVTQFNYCYHENVSGAEHAAYMWCETNSNVHACTHTHTKNLTITQMISRLTSLVKSTHFTFKSHELCDPGQVTWHLWASVSLTIKVEWWQHLSQRLLWSLNELKEFLNKW